MAKQRARKSNETLNTDLAPTGADIEPIEAPREDVEMDNDEDDESWAAEVPRAKMNPMDLTSQEKQEHEYSGHRSWCAPCVEGRGLGGEHRIESLDNE